MSPALFVSLLFISGALAAWGLCCIVLGWRHQHTRRIQQRLHGVSAGRAAAEARLLLQQHELGAIGEVLRRYHFFQELRATLKQAMPDLSVEMFLYMTAGVTLLLFAVTFGITRSLAVGCVAAVVGAYLPFLVVSRKRSVRQKLLAEQLPDGLDFLNRSLRAGHSLPVGLQMMSNELPAPLCEEFSRCYDAVSLGGNIEHALKAMTERIDSTDFAFFVTAVLVQRQTGGDLSQVLENISGMLRQRIQLQQHVKARTAEGRFTGLILSIFPLVMFLILYALNPQYTQLLLTTSVGNMFLAAALVLSAIGNLVIRRITTVRF